MSVLADAETQNRELAELLHRCAQGSQPAFRALYEAAAPQLFALLLRMLKRRDLAEETLQEAFVQVWQRAASYDASKGAVRTWLFSIARYRALDLLRKETRLVAVDDLPGVLEAQSAEAEPLPRSASEQRTLEACLERLQAGQRRALELAYFDACTQDEIARVTGSPLGTVKSWIRRGLDSLKRCLGG